MKKQRTRLSKNRPESSGATVLREAHKYLANTYKRPEIVFTHGKGCVLYDTKGRAYLDFLGGIAVNALGHAHPRMVRAIRREAGRATHVSNLFHNPYQAPLAKKLAKWSGMDRVFYTNSGAESVEAGMKLARARARAKHGEGKTRVLAMENSFHGRTFGALAVTWTLKYRAPFEPLMPNVEFVKFNDVTDLEAKFDDSVCAVLMETIQGEGGIYSVNEAFFNRARELATKHDAALIADEIQCGLGRTGREFAYQKFSARPDIVLVAKPLAGGLPLGAMLASEEFASTFVPGMHGTTFGGGPLVCAAALEFLTVVEETDLLKNVRERGAEMREGLEKLAKKYSVIAEIRGEGLMIGLQLAVDGAPYLAEALKRGVLINCTHEKTLRFLPPFIIKSADVKEFLSRMDTVFSKTASFSKTKTPNPNAADAARAKSPAEREHALAAVR
jgi:acetylornithine/N-succinyldiaminopimelate aminotransferase